MSMRWQPVDSKYVMRVIKQMDKNKSPGSDLVRMSDLKVLVDKVSPVISNLVNLSVQSGLFPSMLKEAIVRPIYKKGEHKDYRNYRPIAILSSIDKIMEKCVVNRLSNYLQNNNVLVDCQHGFQKGKSTNTLLSRFTDEINGYLNDKKFVVAVFFDFKKAFDTLETETLLNAMDECGVREPLNSWFRDYLTSRSYRVKVGEEFSDAREVTCGVPQGSGCGPVCYLMHVNSLCGVLRHCSAYMFADDLCALRAGNDLAETCRLVQEDVDSVVKWSHDNGIVLNADKTKLLIIHSPYLRLLETNHNIYTHSFDCIHNNYINCSCKPIEHIDCITYLGVKIDNNFSWSSHVDYICNKLRSLLGRFYHLSFKVPLSTLKCLYLSLVDSILSYSLDCYGLTFRTNIQKLESIQIRFLKMLVNKKTKDSCKEDYTKLFKICKILPISLKHKYLILLNNHSRKENLTLVAHDHCTKSVSVGKYEVPRVNNYFGDRMLDKRIPYLLNTLPTDIRQETNKNRFASKLKRYLLSNL
ncbi:reverse transcriptase (RNA-dependent DNA polymerase) domain-containing protein [Phthorimaea operculella]|nr:reverse transcriptase (RNA-dependent DNA polymerase) domain-containing protein [Phthorimaea operculella]